MKKIIFGLILISLILLSGATGCTTKTEPATTSSSGLDVQFSKDAPPVSVNVNQEFPIYIDVLNSGGGYIPKGDAKFYLTSVSNLENVQTSLVNSRTLNKESISPDKLVFAEKARFPFALQSLFVMSMGITSCYKYGTSTQATVCIISSNESAICSIEGEKITSDSNSVAPVQISSLTEEIVSNKLRITMVISNNLGTGQVYLRDSDCDKIVQKDYAESSSKKDKVNIELRTPEKGLTCKLQEASFPYNTIDSLTGVADLGRVVCEKPLSSEETVSPLHIVLRYTYVSSIIKNLNILP
ncbi:MAG: hypothetical protein KKE23_03065 [Nanoarchaeota archaeon]|nr:hypothetical protein [Nanoarchaeota archaeon]